MSTTGQDSLRHPVSQALACLSEGFAELASVPVWSLDAASAREALLLATRVEAQAAAAKARIAGHAVTVEVEASSGATSAAAWWAVESRQTRRQTAALVRLGTALAQPHLAPLAAAFDAGEVVAEQAQVIVTSIERLPADLPAEQRDRAVAMMVDLAGHHDAKDLAVLGKHLLTAIDPDLGEAADAAALEREEREAAQSARLTMTRDGHGRVHGRFTIPELEAAMLERALLGLAAPKHQATVSTGSTGGRAPLRPGAEKLGRAFCEYVSRYPVDRLPDAGGVAATIVVTMTHRELLDGLAPARLDTGQTLSASAARRLACEAGIIPAVLGGASQPLDLGRKRRFHTTAMRLAMGLRDGGCTADGCDWPPGMCHAHHDTPWAAGGSTDLDTGRLLCPRHHARAHDPTYAMTRQPGGKVAFHRRT